MSRPMPWSVVSALAVGLIVVKAEGPPPELPASTFFRDPFFSEAKLAPDGAHLAILGVHQEKRNILVMNVATRQGLWMIRTSEADHQVYDLFWASRRRLVFQMQDTGFATGGLFAIDYDGKRDKVLIDPVAWQDPGWAGSLRAVDILSAMSDDADHVLVEWREFDRLSRAQDWQIPDLRRLNVMTGRSTVIEKNPGQVRWWGLDSRGEPRLALALSGGQIQVLYRETTKRPWRPLAQGGLQDDVILPEGFAGEGEHLLVRFRNGQNTEGIYRYDPVSGARGEVLWHAADYDAGDLILLPCSAAPLGILLDEAKPRMVLFDASWQSLVSSLEETFAGQLVIPHSASEDGRRVVFLVSNDRHPGTYYLFDRDTRKLDLVGPKAPLIRPELMAPMQPVRFAARDGLELNGYLTLPIGRGGQHLPLVVLVHGGPWARDSWGWNEEVQFFANRGYAVLQVNYRGSTGFGWHHFAAGFREWGRKMQDDLVDAVQWLIERGVADPKRVAICGGSYGGYAALMGVARDPDLFCCAVSIAGVSDVVRQLRATALRHPAIHRFSSNLLVGDIKTDRERLEAASPVELAGSIRVPVLLAYGGSDERVNVAQGKRMAAALREHGKEFELIVESEEGHGFHLQENRIRLYERIDEFLKKHLAPTPGS